MVKKTKRLLATGIMALAISQAFTAGSAQASSEPFVGEIQLFAFNFAPVGFAECDGRTLNITSNTALFSLLGTTYGGNGTTTFALPDLRGASPTPGVKYYIATQGAFPSRP